MVTEQAAKAVLHLLPVPLCLGLGNLQGVVLGDKVRGILRQMNRLQVAARETLSEGGGTAV